MARLSLIAPFRQFRGTVSMPDAGAKQILYDDVHRGRVSRNWTKTPNPRTPAQLGQRTRIALCAQAWRALSAPDAAAWRALATQINRTNSLGYTYTLTGINVFYQVNTYRLMIFHTLTATPPSIADIPPPPTAIIWCHMKGAQLEVVVDCAGSKDMSYGVLRCTPSDANQARLRRPCELRFPTTDPADCFTSANSGIFHFLINPTLSPLNDTEWIGLQILSMTDDCLPRPPWFIPLIQLLDP